jgi:hypothetical protein
MPVFFSVLLANVFVGAGNGSYPAPAKRETARERAWQQERRGAGQLCCARPFAGSKSARLVFSSGLSDDGPGEEWRESVQSVSHLFGRRGGPVRPGESIHQESWCPGAIFFSIFKGSKFVNTCPRLCLEQNLQQRPLSLSLSLAHSLSYMMCRALVHHSQYVYVTACFFLLVRRRPALPHVGAGARYATTHGAQRDRTQPLVHGVRARQDLGDL